MRKKIALGGLMMVATMVLAEPAMAQELSSSGVMNDVLKRFHDAAATWGPAIESAASRLFWTLVVISMVWTFGMMALRKADHWRVLRGVRSLHDLHRLFLVVADECEPGHEYRRYDCSVIANSGRSGGGTFQ